jgi:Predicted 3'-5' exonuclease related to the exonuclease domain of PolB
MSAEEITSKGGFVTCDIETAPQERYVHPEFYQKDRPDAIEMRQDWLEEHENDEEVETAITLGEAPLEATHVTPSLHATTCHIVQVSFGWRAPMGNQPLDLHRKIVQSNQFQGLDRSPMQIAAECERQVLRVALDVLAGACAKGSVIVTFNGKGFDIPVLRARAAILGIPMPGFIPWRRLLYPYADNQHADLRLILSGDDRRAWGTLQWWADSLGIHAEEHGAEVFGWVRAGEWGKLDRYGMVEAQTLVEMYERVRPIL